MEPTGIEPATSCLQSRGWTHKTPWLQRFGSTNTLVLWAFLLSLMTNLMTKKVDDQLQKVDDQSDAGAIFFVVQ
ncbi:MAG: hypothetical protein M3071_06365, partial [Actinomycetota bacterium]|nr:hypothetical protein [Actinomycetota bacterium]